MPLEPTTVVALARLAEPTAHDEGAVVDTGIADARGADVIRRNAPWRRL